MERPRTEVNGFRSSETSSSKGVKREELGAGSDGTADYRLDKGHFDFEEASPGENLLNGDGVLIEEGLSFTPMG